MHEKEPRIPGFMARVDGSTINHLENTRVRADLGGRGQKGKGGMERVGVPSSSVLADPEVVQDIPTGRSRCHLDG